ncbi:MAG: hypothetical protein WA252_18625 [Candidatus Sulfotelmatobacter sp.]
MAIILDADVIIRGERKLSTSGNGLRPIPTIHLKLLRSQLRNSGTA